MTMSPISRWIHQVLEHSMILSKTSWATILGTRSATLAQYASGDVVPDARTLRSLVHVLEDHESDEARRFCEQWHELAQRPIHDVYPSARTDAPTLAHYVLGPLWEDHRVAVAALPAHEQEQLLQTGICEATRWMIARNRAEAGLPMVLCDDDLWERKDDELDELDELAVADASPSAPSAEPVWVAPAAAPEPAPAAAVPAAPTPTLAPRVRARATEVVDEGPASEELQLAPRPDRSGDDEPYWSTPRVARGSTPAISAKNVPSPPAASAPSALEPAPRPPPPIAPAPATTRLAILRSWVPLHDRLPHRPAATRSSDEPAAAGRDQAEGPVRGRPDDESSKR